MSVFEYIFAMNLVWKFAIVTGNSCWKGLTWGMLPMHASSICAVTHHFFYNNEGLQFLVTTQGFLTCLGNTTTMIAAFRIAKSNGWTVRRVCCCRDAASESGTAGMQHQQRFHALNTTATDGSPMLIAKLTGFSIVASYVIKYGELAFEFPATANAVVALSMIIAIPLVTASYYAFLSIREQRQPVPLVQDEKSTEKETLGQVDVLDEESPLLPSR